VSDAAARAPTLGRPLENAVQEELITRNVAKLVLLPTPHYAIGRGLTLEQARKLLHEAMNDRLYALYVLALLLGLRRAELLGLSWHDIDLGKGTLTIRQSLQRVGGELKLVPTSCSRPPRARR